eukprot:TRINITY_DN7673_c0_g1_i1.p1 TRINITY_DN7673_c0_g1~~TRINITY_DN7673_c0_g1_i1.p1  ORF type:complete len:214 (-),score=34.94 TRINITY_DN7673_c0_g1_i1:354-911(-)
MRLQLLVAVGLLLGGAEGHGHSLTLLPNGSYVCKHCGWIYNPVKQGKSFVDEAADFKCPWCSYTKDNFEELTEANNDTMVCASATMWRFANGTVVDNGRRRLHSDAHGEASSEGFTAKEDCDFCWGFPCAPAFSEVHGARSTTTAASAASTTAATASSAVSYGHHLFVLERYVGLAALALVGMFA